MEVLARDLPDACFLPGVRVDRGRLLVDEARLLYPGDLLHEAGHVAIMPAAERREREGDVGADLGVDGPHPATSGRRGRRESRRIRTC